MLTSNNSNIPSISNSATHYTHTTYVEQSNLGYGMGAALGKIIGTYDRPIGEPGPLDHAANFVATAAGNWKNNMIQLYSRILSVPLSSHPTSLPQNVRLLSEFAWHERKTKGEMPGALYLDENQNKWLIKQSSSYAPYIFNEYIGGALHQYILGNESAPRTDLILRDQSDFNTYKFQAKKLGIFQEEYGSWFENSDILIGSKFLTNFNMLIKNSENYKIAKDEVNPEKVAISIHNKKIKNIHKCIYSFILLNEKDPHFGNLGLVEKDDYYLFSKVDHSFSFRNDPWNKDIEREIASNYHRIVLNYSNIDATKQLRTHVRHAFDLEVIEEIANLNVDEMIQIINQKYENISELIAAANENRIKNNKRTIQENINDLKATTIGILKKNHEAFVALNNNLKDPNYMKQMLARFPDEI